MTDQADSNDHNIQKDEPFGLQSSPQGAPNNTICFTSSLEQRHVRAFLYLYLGGERVSIFAISIIALFIVTHLDRNSPLLIGNSNLILIMLIAFVITIIFLYIPSRTVRITKPVRWTISPSEIATEAADVKADHQWSGFQKVVFRRTIITFHTKHYASLFIPKDCVSIQHQEIIASWAKSAGVSVHGRVPDPMTSEAQRDEE